MESSSKTPLCSIKDHDNMGLYINGPDSVKITDPIVIENLKNFILNYWPNRKNNHFPGALPVSLERKSLYKLKQYPYLICFKSDGVRMMLLQHLNKIYMVDRSFVFYLIHTYDEKETMNTSTLFDGELVFLKNSNKWSYIIYDCILIKDKDVSHEIFYNRYSNIHPFIENWPKEINFSISGKKFYKFNEVNSLLEDMKTLEYREDGLIFTPVTLPIGTQTQYTLFKWKKVIDHTFDFKIVETNISICAYVNQGQSDILFASVDKNTKEGISFLKVLKERCPMFKSGDIVECRYDEKNTSYVPYIHRSDKSHPNSLFTIEKIILNISEDITFDEIIKFIKT